MLTAKSSESDRVAGLELGADDYVTKPFSLRELTARVRAVLRRSTTVEERPATGYQGTRLTADFDAVAVAVDGDSIRLTRREFELLRYLAQNKNRVVSRDRLLERVWVTTVSWKRDRWMSTSGVAEQTRRRGTADRDRGRAGLSIYRLRRSAGRKAGATDN
jgi:DNA-binding response OmpR family regulator